MPLVFGPGPIKGLELLAGEESLFVVARASHSSAAFGGYRVAVTSREKRRRCNE